jgi:hypothetical protein
MPELLLPELPLPLSTIMPELLLPELPLPLSTIMPELLIPELPLPLSAVMPELLPLEPPLVPLSLVVPPSPLVPPLLLEGSSMNVVAVADRVGGAVGLAVALPPGQSPYASKLSNARYGNGLVPMKSMRIYLIVCPLVVSMWNRHAHAS